MSHSIVDADQASSHPTSEKKPPMSKEELTALIQSVQTQTDENIRYGEPGDQHRNVEHKKEYISLFEEHNIPWCIAEEIALLYYGVPLISPPIHTICVPDNRLEEARDALLGAGLYKMTQVPEHDDIFATYPLLKRKGVHLNIRFLPSSFLDIDVEVDCVDFFDEGTKLHLRAPRPESLMHALLHVYSTRNHFNNLVMAEYLILHNANDPEWDDSLADKLKVEEEKKTFLRLCRTREKQRGLPGGIYRGKWDDTTNSQKLGYRVYC